MPGAVNCEMLLYADDTCLVFQAKDLDTISDGLNTEFNKLCDWFVDNKLSIHFGEDKTKSILLTGKIVLRMISSISLEVGLTSLNIGRSITWVVCLMKNPPVSLCYLR
jgi:hypothetical protein